LFPFRSLGCLFGLLLSFGGCLGGTLFLVLIGSFIGSSIGSGGWGGIPPLGLFKVFAKFRLEFRLTMGGTRTMLATDIH